MGVKFFIKNSYLICLQARHAEAEFPGRVLEPISKKHLTLGGTVLNL